MISYTFFFIVPKGSLLSGSQKPTTLFYFTPAQPIHTSALYIKINLKISTYLCLGHLHLLKFFKNSVCNSHLSFMLHILSVSSTFTPSFQNKWCVCVCVCVRTCECKTCSVMLKMLNIIYLLLCSPHLNSSFCSSLKALNSAAKASVIKGRSRFMPGLRS
jgi:hypothetical protein